MVVVEYSVVEAELACVVAVAVAVEHSDVEAELAAVASLAAAAAAEVALVVESVGWR